MELRHLRHFLAVADALSYSRAAEALHMAASPLSRSIQEHLHQAVRIGVGNAPMH